MTITTSRTNSEPSSHRSDALRVGAHRFMLLLDRIRDINDCTIDRLGEGLDGRDYLLIAKEVEGSLRSGLFEAEGAEREGFVRAFGDFMSICADGCNVSGEWDPLRNTAASFACIPDSA